MSRFLFGDEGHSIGADAFLAAGEAELLSGRGLDGDGVDVAADDACHGLLHVGDVRIHLGTLGTDGGIDVNELVALGGYELDGLPEDDLTVHAFRFVGGIGPVVAYVAHVGGAEDGVADGVNQHVGIAVAQEA